MSYAQDISSRMKIISQRKDGSHERLFTRKAALHLS